MFTYFDNATRRIPRNSALIAAASKNKALTLSCIVYELFFTLESKGCQSLFPAIVGRMNGETSDGGIENGSKSDATEREV